MAVRATRVSLALLSGWWLCVALPAAAEPRFEVLFTQLNGAPISAAPVLLNLDVGDVFTAEVRLTADPQLILFYSVSLEWERRTFSASPGVSLDTAPIFEAGGPLLEGSGFSYSYGGASVAEPFLGQGESIAIAEIEFEAVGGSDGELTPIEISLFDPEDAVLVLGAGALPIELPIDEIDFRPGSVSVLPEPGAALNAAGALATLLAVARRRRTNAR